MIAVAEAPGKVILTGEHFVVHGAWSLAAAVDRVVRVDASDSDSNSVTSDRFPTGTPGLAPVRETLGAVQKELSSTKGVRVVIRSHIPQGAGLGSSAATMVAVVSAVARLRSCSLGAADVIRLAMSGEREVHGKPSGVDPTVCAMGGAVLFRPADGGRRVKVDGSRSLVVAYSGRSRSTRRQISRVSSVKEAFPALFEGLTESVSELSLIAARMLRRGDSAGLGKVFNINHAVLRTIGVSTRPIDRLVADLVTAGCYGAKVTGGGGGGSVVAVAPAGKEKRAISALRARGIDSFLTSVPRGGVRSWLRR